MSCTGRTSAQRAKVLWRPSRPTSCRGMRERISHLGARRRRVTPDRCLQLARQIGSKSACNGRAVHRHNTSTTRSPPDGRSRRCFLAPQTFKNNPDLSSAEKCRRVAGRISRIMSSAAACRARFSSVSSSLLKRYDEPEALPCSIQKCPRGAEPGQVRISQVAASRRGPHITLQIPRLAAGMILFEIASCTLQFPLK
jgi:hypothetical protein